MIATLGEALVDMIEQADGRFQPCLGGSVCNFSIGLARQGLPVTYLNPLSEDRFGRQFAALLTQNGVALATESPSRSPTSLAVVSIGADGGATYAFHRGDVADRDIDIGSIIGRLPQQIALFHTGGLALVPQDIDKVLATISEAKQRGALISVDANLRPIAVNDLPPYLDAVRRVLHTAHIVKVSGEDLECLGIDRSSPDWSKTLFGDSSVELIALTEGGHGATLITRSQTVALGIPAAVNVVDTVGAGDTFHAALLAYLLRSCELATSAQLSALAGPVLHSALGHAVAAASLNVMTAGCNPPTWEQTLAFDSRAAE